MAAWRTPDATDSATHLAGLGQIVDVMLSRRRDLPAAKAFFVRALAVGVKPTEVTTDGTVALVEDPAGRLVW